MDLLLKLKWVWLILGMFFMSVVISLIFLVISKCISRKGKHTFLSFQRAPVSKTESNKYQERNPEATIPTLPPRTQFLTAEAQSYENLAEVPDYEQCTADYEQNIPDYEQNTADYEQSTADYEQSTADYEQSTADYEQDIHNYEQNIPDYEQSTADYEQSTADYEQNIPDYEQSTADYEQDIHNYEQNIPDYEQSIPDYEQNIPDYEQNIPDYEQSTDQQPDYVTMDVEAEILLPPPPYGDSKLSMKFGVSAGQSYENLAEEPDYEQSLDEQPDYVKVDVEPAVLSPRSADPAADNSSTDDYDDIGGESQDEEDYDDIG